MALDPAILDANRAATARIRSLAGSLTDEQFRHPVGEHWTVAMVFVHLAFGTAAAWRCSTGIEAAGRDTEVDIDLVWSTTCRCRSGPPSRRTTRRGSRSRRRRRSMLGSRPTRTTWPPIVLREPPAAGSGAASTATSILAKPQAALDA